MRFSMSSVFGGAFSILGKSFVPLAIVTLILYLGPSLAVSVVMRMGLGINMATLQAWQGSLMPVTLVVSLAMYFMTFMHMSAVTEIAVLKAVDKPVNIGEVLAHAGGNAIPIFGIYVLCAIGWALGLFAFIIPAFIFGTIFSVVIPAYVGEKPGFFGAFTRSRTLTKGHRWGIFGMWLLILIAFYIAAGMIEMPVLMPYFREAIQVARTGAEPTQFVPSLTSMSILSVAFSILWVILLVFNASFYAALRGEKEQYSGDRMEKLFE